MSVRYFSLPPVPPRDEIPKIIKRIADDGTVAFIPMDDGNADYREYLEWVAAGNEPEPFEE